MKDLRIYDLVVLNHSLDAAIFRVKELQGKHTAGVIDADIEDSHPNQAIQWVDISTLMRPTRGQRNRFTTRHDRSIQEALND